jgi:alpha-1,3-rhamnosyl/mannosyltransferase
VKRRVGVNLTWLTPGVVGGSEEASVAAVLAVGPTAAAENAELVVFGSRGLFAAHPRLAEVAQPVVVDSAGGSRPRRILGEATELVARARRQDIDLLHHGGGVLPLRSVRPATVTVHDIQPLDLPGNFSRTKTLYLSAMLRRTVRSATAVAVPSDFVAGRLVDRLGADRDRISVVPWCVLPAPAATSTPSAAVAAGLGIAGPYVVYPAITHPHKNHAVLIAASELVAPGVTIVFCGAAGDDDRRVATAMAATTRPDRMRRLDRLPRGDVLGLIAGAEALVFPSRYEGFGLPVLEAMAAGVPVIASTAGSLPELVGTMAETLDPDDPVAWATAIDRAVSDDAWAASQVASGRRQAARYGPEVTAAALWSVWRAAMLERP